ncbi:MAG: hypothetical protein ACLQU3_02810 [Limisphaerales bacterium]
MRIPRHLPVVVVVTAWLMFIVSFFLPATDVVELGGTAPGTPLTGWQALTTSVDSFGHPLTFLFVLKEPRTLLLLAFPFINLIMLLAPLVVALVWEEAWMVSGVFLLFCFVPWLLPKELTGNQFVGFFLWDLSFFLMGAGCILASIAWKQACEAQIQRLHESAA